MYHILLYIAAFVLTGFGVWKYYTRIEPLGTPSTPLLMSLECPSESLQIPSIPLDYPLTPLGHPAEGLIYPLEKLVPAVEKLEHPSLKLVYPSKKLIIPSECIMEPLKPLEPPIEGLEIPLTPLQVPSHKIIPHSGKYGPGHECSKDSQCADGACARATADKGAKTVCCPSGERDLFGGYWYCKGMKSGSTCWSDAMCSSGDCEGNWGGLRRGKCT